MVWYGITILLKAEQRNGKSGLMDGRKACVDGLLMHLHLPSQEIWECLNRAKALVFFISLIVPIWRRIETPCKSWELSLYSAMSDSDSDPDHEWNTMYGILYHAIWQFDRQFEDAYRRPKTYRRHFYPSFYWEKQMTKLNESIHLLKSKLLNITNIIIAIQMPELQNVTDMSDISV